MERLQTKGEAAEEELKALELDMTGKVRTFLKNLSTPLNDALQLLLASWRGTRFEVMQVLREVR